METAKVVLSMWIVLNLFFIVYYIIKTIRFYINRDMFDRRSSLIADLFHYRGFDMGLNFITVIMLCTNGIGLFVVATHFMCLFISQ